MRHWLMLSAAATLAACGGGTAPQSVGGSAPPPAAGGGGGTPTPTAHSFVNPSEPRTYDGIGGAQHYRYTTDSRLYDPATGLRVANRSQMTDPSAEPLVNGQYNQLYAGDANTVRDSGISITYNPRDAIFELTIKRPKANVDVTAFRFQDPAHRTDHGGMRGPQPGVPNIDAALAAGAPSRQIQYLQTGSSNGNLIGPGSPYLDKAYAPTGDSYQVGDNLYTYEAKTFFYQKPGTTTKYVTYAGYVTNRVSGTEVQPDPTQPAYLIQNYSFDRAAFAFGERTGNGAVPRSGTATFSGDMLATMVFNPEIDNTAGFPTFLQWIVGNQTSMVNFADLSVKTDFTGTVTAPTFDAYTSWASVMPAGSQFFASATSLIDLVNKGGFTGQFTSARFSRPGMSDFTINIAGSSIDGAFFGPAAEEIGGGFRVVGGTPDERIDILGTFTGKK